MAHRTGPDRWLRWATGAMPVYLLAHFAKSQLWHGSMLLFGFFLTEACALDARTMGWVMAGTLLVNAVVDTAIGRHRGMRGIDARTACRRQAWGAPVTCLCFVLFGATPLIAPDLRTGWAIAALVGFRASYAFLDVPQNMLAVLSTPSAAARDALLTRRNIASGLAALAVSAVAAPLLIHGHGARVYLMWTGVASVFVCGTAWWLARSGETGTAPSVATGPVAAPPLSFAAILCALATMIFANVVFRAMEPYHAAFVDGAASLLLWAAIGGLAGHPLWLFVRRRVATATMLATIAGVLATVAILLLTPLRAVPVGAACAGMGFGAGAGGLWFLLWSAMTAHAARGAAGCHVGTFTGVSKLAQAAAMPVLGGVLARSAYRETLADPLSAPSLLATGAVATIAATCVVLALLLRTGAGAGDTGPSLRPRSQRLRDRELSIRGLPRLAPASWRSGTTGTPP